MWYCHVYRKKESKSEDINSPLGRRPGYMLVDFAIRVEDPDSLVGGLSGGEFDGTYKIDDDHELSFDSEMLHLCLYSHLVTIKVINQEVPDGDSAYHKEIVHVETADGMAMSLPAQNNLLELFANSFVKRLLPDDLE